MAQFVRKDYKPQTARPKTGFTKSRLQTTLSTQINTTITPKSQFTLTQSRSEQVLKTQRLKSASSQRRLKFQFYVPEGLTQIQLQQIFQAKCLDLGIPILQDQALRFYNVCQKCLKSRYFNLEEFGLGENSASVISSILRITTSFCKVNLGKNSMGDKGSMTIVKSLVQNSNILHLDLSSNNISPKGSSRLVKCLIGNESLTSFDLQSHEGLNRNRIGLIGCKAIMRWLQTNNVLTILNLSGTSINFESLGFLLQGVISNQTLLSLNLGNNNLMDRSAELLCQAIPKSKIQELSLQGNKLGDEGAIYLSNLLGGDFGVCHIIKLNLARNGITHIGANKIFSQMKSNVFLKSLVLDFNPIGTQLNTLVFLFIENKSVTSLSMSNCDLETEGIGQLHEGLIRTKGISHLYLANNLIDDQGAQIIANGLMRNTSLRVLDLTGNRITNNGGRDIGFALRSNTFIKKVYLNNNNLNDLAGQFLLESVRINSGILALDLQFNTINFKIIHQIQEQTRVNKQKEKKQKAPDLKRRVDQLQIKQGAIDQIKRKIEDAKEDKNYWYKKFETAQGKLEELRKIEAAKTKEVQNELEQVKQQNYEKSVQLNKIREEFNKEKIMQDQIINKLQDKTSEVVAAYRKLEKVKSVKREQFALRRSQLESRMDDLESNLKEANRMKQMAQDTVLMTQNKIKQMKQEIEILKNPQIARKASTLNIIQDIQEANQRPKTNRRRQRKKQ